MKKFPYTCIDLNHALDGEIPSWNMHCGFEHKISLDYSDNEGECKFRVMQVSMDAGIGTHMDAPSHCIPKGKSIDDFDVNELIMPCVVIDVQKKTHPRYSLSIDDIIDFENRYGLIMQGSCVLVKTGWSQFWNYPLKYHNQHVFPSVSFEAARLLISRGVNALGIDTLSPDRPEDGFKVHNLFLGLNKIIIENVANLDNMPLSNTYIMIFPMKIKNGTEAPIRLIGLIENKKT